PPPTSPPPTSTLFPYTTLFRSQLKRTLANGARDGRGVSREGVAKFGGTGADFRSELLGTRVDGATDLAQMAVEGLVEEGGAAGQDRKSTRLNSSHSQISYAVFC